VRPDPRPAPDGHGAEHARADPEVHAVLDDRKLVGLVWGLAPGTEHGAARDLHVVTDEPGLEHHAALGPEPHPAAHLHMARQPDPPEPLDRHRSRRVPEPDERAQRPRTDARAAAAAAVGGEGQERGGEEIAVVGGQVLRQELAQTKLLRGPAIDSVLPVVGVVFLGLPPTVDAVQIRRLHVNTVPLTLETRRSGDVPGKLAEGEAGR
jgi:hypothetical protein